MDKSMFGTSGDCETWKKFGIAKLWYIQYNAYNETM